MKRYHYFIAFFTPKAVANVEVSLDSPITSKADIELIQQHINESFEGPATVVSWRRFEEPE